MIALLRVESLRLWSRRLYRWLTLLAIVAFVVASVIVYFTSKPTDIFRFAEIDEVFMGLSVPFLALGWLIGASAMGAEWQNRTVTSLLTWEPRRMRVLAAKYAITMGLVAAWLVLLCSVLAGLLALVASAKGTFAGADGVWLGDFGRLIVKIAAAGALSAGLGLSLSTIGRNTAAALGVGFAYLAIVEGLVRGFKPSWIDWLLGDNLSLFLFGSADVNHVGHSQLAAAAVILGYLAILVITAAAFFRTREIA